MKKQKRKTEATAETTHPYQVIVGNIGEVYDGPKLTDARKDFEFYKRRSASKFGGRVKGEAVTLMAEGEPLDEHPGWVSSLEDTEALIEMLNTHRKTHPATCAICGGDVESSEPVMNDPDISVARRCTNCGFEWTEDYTFELANVSKDL